MSKLKEKVAKGYQPIAGSRFSGAATAMPIMTPEHSGYLPMLLNFIDETEALRLIADPAWLCQEKSSASAACSTAPPPTSSASTAPA